MTLFRLTLITKGHRFDLDEDRYLAALYFWTALVNGDVSFAFELLFCVQGRPGFVVLSIIPAGIQQLLLKANIINTQSLHFYDIVSLFNVAVLTINGVLFYRIVRLLSNSKSAALTGSIIYGVLVNTNLYIRHLFPYDHALLFYFIAIWLIVRDWKSGRLQPLTPIYCGLLCALSILTYPGYILLSIVIAVSLIGLGRGTILRFIIPFIAVIMAMEVFSNGLKRSYLTQLAYLSTTVNHGSYAEGFSFMPTYLMEVEGL